MTTSGFIGGQRWTIGLRECRMKGHFLKQMIHYNGAITSNNLFKVEVWLEDAFVHVLQREEETKQTNGKFKCTM